MMDEYMEAVFYTNKGSVRDTNQDALFVAGRVLYEEDMPAPKVGTGKDVEIFCVIDGMGGYAGGETAARLTALAFDYAEAGVNGNKEWLEKTLRRAQEKMRDDARQWPKRADMGAVLAGLIINRAEKSVFTFNVGDCRVYRFRGGYLDKLTRDHSLVQGLFERGEISEDEMRTHPKKNIVTSGIMANSREDSPSEIFCREAALKDGDKFFVCSDGVWEALPIEEIEKSLANGGALSACSELQKKLFSAGCSDNVSFVFIEAD